MARFWARYIPNTKHVPCEYLDTWGCRAFHAHCTAQVPRTAVSAAGPCLLHYCLHLPLAAAVAAAAAFAIAGQLVMVFPQPLLDLHPYYTGPDMRVPQNRACLSHSEKTWQLKRSFRITCTVVMEALYCNAVMVTSTTWKNLRMPWDSNTNKYPL